MKVLQHFVKIERAEWQLAENSRVLVFGKESLLKGKDQYDWPPSTNKFRSAVVYTDLFSFIQNKVP
jgi:hypothetical protein